MSNTITMDAAMALDRVSDNEFSVKCMNVLIDAVGPVGAERFVNLVTNSSFDYTEWQKDLFKDETFDSLYKKVESFVPGSGI